MHGYEVRIYRGGPLGPELRWIAAASDEAAAERAEELFVEASDATGVEVMRAGARVHVRGIVPVTPGPIGRPRRSSAENRRRLWALMQRIERCRHRAELAENKTVQGSAAFRAEMAEIAREWRDLARAIEAGEIASNVRTTVLVEGGAPSASVSAAAPSRRADTRSRRPGELVVGLVVGGLGGVTLAAPRWIEASSGVDLDRGSGTLEWAVTVIAPLAAIAAAFALRDPRLRALARGDRRRS